MFKIGDKVRIKRGHLEGKEGIILKVYRFIGVYKIEFKSKFTTCIVEERLRRIEDPKDSENDKM